MGVTVMVLITVLMQIIVVFGLMSLTTMNHHPSATSILVPLVKPMITRGASNYIFRITAGWCKSLR